MVIKVKQIITFLGFMELFPQWMLIFDIWSSFFVKKTNNKKTTTGKLLNFSPSWYEIWCWGFQTWTLFHSKFSLCASTDGVCLPSCGRGIITEFKSIFKAVRVRQIKRDSSKISLFYECLPVLLFLSASKHCNSSVEGMEE